MEIPRAERIREHFLIHVVCDHLDDYSIVFIVVIVVIIVILLVVSFVVHFDATFSFPHAPRSMSLSPSLSLSRTSTSTSLLPSLRPSRPEAGGDSLRAARRRPSAVLAPLAQAATVVCSRRSSVSSRRGVW